MNYLGVFTSTTDLGSSVVYQSGGHNIGIGTSNPRAAGFTPNNWLDISGGLFVSTGANVGNTSFASTTTWPANGGLMAWNKSNALGEIDLINLSGVGTDGGFTFYDRDNQLMRVTKAGNVGIGIPNPTYPLVVNGIIEAQEIIAQNPLSDYVFDPDYRLAPLTEVAGYIKRYHHLPDIPSSAEAQKKGVPLGDMQAKLLAKIEELTLHMIRADEENRELRQRIGRLEAQKAHEAR